MDLSGKVALVTGAAGGIGKGCVEELLLAGIKGVTIADINSKVGEKTTKEFHKTFGSDKVIFVETDVTKKESFENAFQKTVHNFGNIDILINNAGVANEINWEMLIQVNLVGTINGVLLGIEKYLPKYKSGDKSYIINISSICGLTPIECSPHYTATKHGIIGLTRTYGINRHLRKEGILTMALCPAVTDTPLICCIRDTIKYKDIFDDLAIHLMANQQTINSVGRAAIQAMADSDSGSAWVVEGGAAYKVKFPNLDEMMAKN